MSAKKLVSILFALALITGLMAACASPTPTAVDVGRPLGRQRADIDDV